MRAHLRFDRRLAGPCTWRLLADGLGIEAHVRLASGPDVRLELPLRRTRQPPGSLFVRCLDGVVWLVESGVYHPDLPRCDLLLSGAPDGALELMRTW